ncbi:MAG: glycosyltransferase family 2 protein [Paludibacter sp.]|nr:glycosyltransferase family 2 protein [Paludibacter sp.]
MKVSIITISYNRVSCIENAIRSVLSQTYSDVEYIIVDGASTDGTQQVIGKYTNKIDKYLSEPDKGMYNALNKAVRMSSGDIIGLLHSDDSFYDEKTIERYVQAFQETNADIVYANGQYVDAFTGKVKRIYRAKLFKKRYLYCGWIPLHTTIFVKKEVLEQYGLYDEQYNIAADYEISLRWFMQPELKKHFMNDWVVKMKLGGKSTTAALQKQKSAEDFDIIRKYNLCGYFTLCMKIFRKIPQYIIPHINTYK